MFFPVLNSIGILCIFMAIGYICYKKGIIYGDGISVLSGLLVNVTFPLMILVSMQREFELELFKNGILLLFITFGIHIFGIISGVLLGKLFNVPLDQKGIWIFMMVFPNTAYMGIPVIGAMYGEEAVFYIAMCTVVFNILSFSLGVRILTSNDTTREKPKWSKLFLSPPIIATVLGFMMFCFSIKLPDTILKAFTSMGNLTTPVSMLVIGAFLAQNDLKESLTSWKAYVVSAARLILMPLCIYAVFSPFIKNEIMLGTLFMITGMPAATILAILSERHGQNSVEASRLVFLSTVLSVITLPVLTLLL
ncbi:AEC family transporter [Anaeropeptidivorans aminofermentans]|jgi:hypothetical protein|uniref:AEC family transporter n=1 Tax=Anaeropeptidivorans aminofermentans TaxID=2934315 RepID=UPI00202563A0|nr:AEC family transporter [Anaeropeptidivorans aminofermentans]